MITIEFRGLAVVPGTDSRTQEMDTIPFRGLAVVLGLVLEHTERELYGMKLCF